MPSQSRLGDMSKGHDGYPPTPSVVTPVSTVFINGIKAVTVDAEFETHTKGRDVHPQSSRKVTGGSPNVFFEGKPAARVDDPISCGDTIGEGSPDVFIN